MAFDLGTLVATVRANTGDFVRGMGQSKSATQKFAGVLKTGLVAAAGAAAVGMAKAVSITAKFERSMDEAGARLGATAEQLEEMKTTALEATATAASGADDAAEAYGVFARAGFTIVESQEALKGVLDLSEASVAGVAEAADIAAGNMKAYGLAAGDAGRISDVLAATANVAKTNVRDLAEGTKFAGQIAGDAGLTFESTNAALAVMAENMIKGGQGGRALRGIVSSLKSPTKQMNEVLEANNISLKEFQEGNEDVVSVLGRINAQVGDSADIFKLFTNEQVTAAKAIGGNSDKIKALTKALEQAQGAARELASKQLDNLSGQLEALKGSLSNLAIILGGGITPNLTVFVKLAVTAVNKVRELASQNEKATASFGAMGTVMKGLVIIGGIIVGAFKLIVGVLEMVVEIFEVAISGIMANVKLVQKFTAELQGNDKAAREAAAGYERWSSQANKSIDELLSGTADVSDELSKVMFGTEQVLKSVSLETKSLEQNQREAAKAAEEQESALARVKEIYAAVGDSAKNAADAQRDATRASEESADAAKAQRSGFEGAFEQSDKSKDGFESLKSEQARLEDKFGKQEKETKSATAALEKTKKGFSKAADKQLEIAVFVAKKFNSTLDSMISAVTGSVPGVGSFVSGMKGFVNMLRNGGSLMQAVGVLIADLARGAIEALTSSDAFNEAMKGVGDMLTSVFETDGLVGILAETLGFLAEILGAFIKAVEPILVAIEPILRALFKVLGPVLKAIAVALQVVLKMIGSALINVALGLTSFAGAIVGTIDDFLEVIDKIISSIPGVNADKIKIGEALNGVVDGIADTKKDLKDTRSKLSDMEVGFGSMPDSVGDTNEEFEKMNDTISNVPKIFQAQLRAAQSQTGGLDSPNGRRQVALMTAQLGVLKRIGEVVLGMAAGDALRTSEATSQVQRVSAGRTSGRATFVETGDEDSLVVMRQPMRFFTG